MFRLRRLYLDSIGVADNRFSDLLVDLTDMAGEPTDAIVWLRNGAGKTTMLSLLLALILPDRRDFLATRTKKRTLEDLILGGDTAHVVAEWVDPLGQLLLTGAVYEWDTRVRPRDYNGPGKERLKRMWWCVSPDPAVDGSTLEDLPFTLRTQGRYDLDRFRGHIRGLAGQGVNAVVADQTITEWHSALRERRFDPELFHYFTEVNAAEGGIEGLFAGIDSPGAFVRYLLRFVGDKQRVAPVRELLADTAVEIAKRPTYLAERDFCAQAQPRVAALGEAHAKVLELAKERDDVRRVAAGYKRALIDTAQTADKLREIALGRYVDLDSAFKDARAAGNTARRRRDEYLRLAAAFRVDTAAANLSAAKEEVDRLAIEMDAWRAVEDIVSLATAQATLRVRNQALAEAAADASPIVAALDAAKAVLAGALDAAIADAEDDIDEKRAALGAAGELKTTAENERRAFHKEGVHLDSEQRELSLVVERFDDAKAQAVADGVMDATERLDLAVYRHRHAHAACAARIKRLTGERSTLSAAIEVAQGRLQDARRGAKRAEDQHRSVAGELAALEHRAARLGDRPRLRDLLQSDSVDLLVSANDAMIGLRQAVAAAEVELIDARAAAAEDERAVQALTTHGLLPARPEVTHVIDELSAAGVTAHSGWRYLAEHVPVEEHPSRVAELPEIVDGVVVYGDPAGAAARIDGDVDDLVVLASATTFRDRRDPHVVLGPAPARHDPTAAAAELERRRARLTSRATELAGLEEKRQADAGLAAQIQALVNDLPDDGIDGLRRRVAVVLAKEQQARAQESETSAHLDSLREQYNTCVEQLGEERATLTRLESNLRRVNVLATEERDHVDPARARLEAVPELRQAAAEAEDRAEVQYREADALIQRLREELRGLEASCRAWATRRSVLPDSATQTDLHIEAAAEAVAEVESHLRERFPEAALRHARDEAEKLVKTAADNCQRHDSRVRERATALAETATGRDRDLRVEAAAQARDALGRAHHALGSAENEHKTAQEELRAATPQGRVRHTEQVEAPTDRAHAQRLAAAANEEAMTTQQRVGQLERERDNVGAEAERAKNRAGMLRDQADRLRGVDPGPESIGVVPDEEDETRAAVGELAADLDAAEAAYGTAASARSQRAEQLRTWAGDDRFASVAEDEHGQAVHRLRELFRSESILERVATRAEDLTADLIVREKAIGQQLDQVETHKQNVVHRLSDLVDDALSVLGRASALSELPAGIGPWEHQRFLVVEARQRPSREQVTLRVGELVDRMVSGGKIELDAVELLWRATEASVVDGFRASVLKPAPDQPTGRTAVEDMRKWSGGENLTASLVLFCVMAKLRAEQRTGAKAGTVGGLVPLDNPLGKANYLPFLELQRRVADASGVQLVFWTGIGDLGAVTAFPRIAAMHKRPSTTRPGRAYVRSDPDNSFTGAQVVDVATSVRDEP